MKNRRNHYRILHVQPDAPPELIRASYRTLMQRMKTHPDLGGDALEASLINRAYAVLRNARSRAAYDRRIGRCGARDARNRDATATTESPVTAKRRGQRPGQRCVFCGTLQRFTASVETGDVCARCLSPLYPAKKAHPQAGSRRAIQRIPRRHPIVFYANNEPMRACNGETEDISLHGMRFLTTRAPRTGATLRIDSELCHATGRVVSRRRAAGAPNRCWIVGVQFLTLRFDNKRGSFISATA